MVFNGFSYRIRKRNKTKTYWTCKTAGCPGSCVLIQGNILKIFREHTHLPSPVEKYKRTDFKFRIKELAVTYPEMKPNDLFEMLLRELDEDAGEYAKTHRKFYTTYASAIRMKCKSGKLVRSSEDNALEYDGYKLRNKYVDSEKSVWGCEEADCPAEYIFDSSSGFNGRIIEHNHPPAASHDDLSSTEVQVVKF